MCHGTKSPTKKIARILGQIAKFSALINLETDGRVVLQPGGCAGIYFDGGRGGSSQVRINFSIRENPNVLIPKLEKTLKDLRTFYKEDRK